MKQRKSTKKYNIDTSVNQSMNANQTHLSDIRQQLRYTIEQLEQHKLSSELQSQKRMIAEQQAQMLREQNQQLRDQLEVIKRELGKFAKKLSKIKEQKSCDKCKGQEELKQKADRQRQIFLKERTVLKSQIAELKKLLDTKTQPLQQSSQTLSSIQNLRRQLQYKNKTIQDQKKIIKYLDDKLSNFQIEKLQTLSYVEQIDQRMQQLQMENLILKSSGDRNLNLSPSRKNGSIKNLERSRSRVSKLSPTRY